MITRNEAFAILAIDALNVRGKANMAGVARELQRAGAGIMSTGSLFTTFKNLEDMAAIVSVKAKRKGDAGRAPRLFIVTEKGRSLAAEFVEAVRYLRYSVAPIYTAGPMLPDGTSEAIPIAPGDHVRISGGTPHDGEWRVMKSR